uniref:Uncharacterized protein n=1 Tax=Scleropages formosus TaxID=113540 RepID=A0A8C9VGN2_SCLFO
MSWRDLGRSGSGKGGGVRRFTVRKTIHMLCAAYMRCMWCVCVWSMYCALCPMFLCSSQFLLCYHSAFCEIYLLLWGPVGAFLLHQICVYTVYS